MEAQGRTINLRSLPPHGAPTALNFRSCPPTRLLSASFGGMHSLFVHSFLATHLSTYPVSDWIYVEEADLAPKDLTGGRRNRPSQ